MLTVAGLHLWRGDRHVLSNVSVAANPGQCVLLTGRNGSGKTTLLRTIAGLLEPEEGSVCWGGNRIAAVRDDYHSSLAYLGHEPPLKSDLSGAENLWFSTGIRRVVTREEISAALARVTASEFAHVPVRGLSAGQRRRIALGGVLLARATLWLLDEPATNLDAEGNELVASLIDDHIANGGIVIAAVHQALPFRNSNIVKLELGVA